MRSANSAEPGVSPSLSGGATSQHVRRETAISGVINAIFSMGFFLLVFGSADPVLVPGIGNFAFDFLPQSFAVGFFATFVPGLLAVKAIRAGRFGEASRPGPGVAPLFLRAVVIGLAAMIVGGGISAGLLLLSGAEQLGYATALLLKVAYGGLLGAYVTRLTLGRMIAKRQGQ